MTDDKLQYKDYQFILDTKSLEGEQGHFSGYLSTFNTVDKAGDIVMPGAWHMARSPLPIIFRHDRNEIIGEVKQWIEDEKGVFIDGELDLNVSKAREVYSLLKRGLLNYLSPGFITRKDSYRSDGKHQIDYGDVYEASITAWPANFEAEITSVKEQTEGLSAEDAMSKIREIYESYNSKLSYKEDDNIPENKEETPVIEEGKKQEDIKPEIIEEAEPVVENTEPKPEVVEEATEETKPEKLEPEVVETPPVKPPEIEPVSEDIPTEPEPEIPIEQTPGYATAAAAVLDLLSDVNDFKAKLDALESMVMPVEDTQPTPDTKEEKDTPR
jgi:HK97 family phage prohead protease